MKRLALALAFTLPSAATADDRFTDTLQRCLAGAADRNHVPPEVLILLYQNEGGALGRISRNTNGTVDIGPFQINQIWLPALSSHWSLPQPLVYHLLLNQLCANAEAAAWILRTNLDAAHGDLWEAVGRYHSADPVLKTGYLRQIYAHLMALIRRTNG
ncbi:MAG: lytic transglycosylase domain-containing protein [Rhodopila sp.]|jgi:hypothetical protein